MPIQQTCLPKPPGWLTDPASLNSSALYKSVPECLSVPNRYNESFPCYLGCYYLYPLFMTNNTKSNIFSVNFLYIDNHKIIGKNQAYKKWTMENLYFFIYICCWKWTWNGIIIGFMTINVILLIMTTEPQKLARSVLKIGPLCTCWWAISQLVMIVMDILVHSFILISATYDNKFSSRNTGFFLWWYVQVAAS